MRDLWSWYYAFVGIHYLPFVIPALVVLVARLCLGRISRRELGLVALVLLLIGLEAVQLWFDGCILTNAHQDFFPTWERYFGVLAPLFWVWTACGIVSLVKFASRYRVFKTIVCVLVGGGMAYMFAFKNVAARYRERTQGAGMDAMVAGEKIARFVAYDYKGPHRFSNFPYTPIDYYTSRRPVVVSFWGCAAWACNGQSQGVNPGYPFREDYYFVRVDKRYHEWLGAELAKSQEHVFLREVKGIKYRWRLYKRIL